MRDDLADLARDLEADLSVRALVLWGGPTCFAAGADIDLLASMGYEEIVRWNRALQRAMTALAVLPFPVVAAVNGPALGGGCELALAADFRVAGRSARLGLPEVRLGIMPGSGGTQRMTRLLGPAVAKRLLMTGHSCRGDEARELGLVDEAVDDDVVLDRALELAQGLAAGPRFALAAIKQAVDEAVDGPGGLALERALIAGLFATRDKEEGFRSFRDSGPGKARFA
jgi:enoyl-CoA hydratase